LQLAAHRRGRRRAAAQVHVLDPLP
jgi:hypothetical protein